VSPKLFIAGATGATGRTLIPIADAKGIGIVPHVRPKKHSGEVDPRAAVLDLADRDALVGALRGCTTVVQLIGTIRKRFASGDTYESSDIGTTRQLAEAAKLAETVDHFVLLSSVGAGRPVGAYLQAKAEAERIVRDSSIPYTIFRPSTFVGAGHNAPFGFGALTRALGLKKLEPIAIEDLARAILQVAADRAPLGAVLEGASLWEVVERSGR